ncbi:MAG: polyhydroxyalkanoate synthesis repressor PhaR, partial [Pseudomonadota bacterium]
KKYANRRLYDTERSTYVTLDDLCEMVKEDRIFNVIEAKTEKDITRSILTQILLEQDAKGKNIMPIGFLRNLIKFYDDGLEKVAARYLDTTMEFFVRNQARLRDQLGKSMNTVNQNMPHMIEKTSTVLEDLQRKNVELFERAVETIRALRKKDQMIGGLNEDDTHSVYDDTPKTDTAPSKQTDL